MIRRTIHIKGWEADIFFCITHYDERVLQDSLESADAPWLVLVRMREIARDDEYNTGFTYSNIANRKSVVVIGKSTNLSEFINTFMHELRHLTDDIASASGMELSGEGVGYLQGEIARDLTTDIIGQFMCPQCRRRIWFRMH